MTDSMHGSVARSTALEPPPSLVEIMLHGLLFLRRHKTVLWVALVSALALGAIYLKVATPKYVAIASMILDMREMDFLRQKPMVNDVSLDSAFVESQVEVFKATNVLSPVGAKLRLAEDPEFVDSTGGPIGDFNLAARSLIGWSEKLSPAELRERALKTLLRNLTVKRVGLSFVIEVGYRSPDAQRAAQIDNAIVDAYLAEQARSKIYAAQRASGWLEESLKGLRARMVESANAVVAFKDANRIVATDGRPIKEREIDELNSQLTAAIGRTSDALARLDRISVVLTELSSSRNPIDATVAESLKSEVISKLRSQFLDLSNQEADWSRRYGSDHQAAVKLRDQMQQIRVSIIEELRRIAASDKSDYEIELQNRKQIQEHLSHAISQSEAENVAQVKLRELESTAKSYREIYEDFMKRYLQTAQEQSFPIADGRLISPAAVPLRVSSPRASVVFLVSTLLGLLVGFVLALLIELRAAIAVHTDNLNRRSG